MHRGLKASRRFLLKRSVAQFAKSGWKLILTNAAAVISIKISLLVWQGSPGLSFGKQEAKMGWNAQPTCSISLDGVRVPQEHRLGEEGQGFSIAMTACAPYNHTSWTQF